MTAKITHNCLCKLTFEVEIDEGVFECPQCGRGFFRRFEPHEDTYLITDLGLKGAGDDR